MTASAGFNKPLYVLSFDHRDLAVAMSGSESMLTAEQNAELEAARSQIALAKNVVYDGFRAAVDAGVPQEKAAILVDEMFGAEILRDASAQGYVIASPAEKAGQDEFDFEYGEDFAKHIESVRPAFCKVRVRYNPDASPDLKRRQLARLKQLSDYLHSQSRSLLLTEIVLPSRNAHATTSRAQLTVEAIHELQDARVEPDVWRIKWLDSREDYEQVVAAARAGGRDNVSCIVRGGGKDQAKVTASMKTAAGVPGCIGFALGRTIFTDPLSQWAGGQATAKAAATRIGRRYAQFVKIFEQE